MKALKILSSLVFFSLFTYSFSPGHDFHTSTTKIEFESEANLIKISSKYFTEDLEKALGVKSTDANFKNSIRTYAMKNFTMKINGNPVKVSFVGAQDTNKATRVFLEIKGVQSVNDIEVKNSMLIDLFPDQQNFIDFNINGSRKSIICSQRKSIATVSFG